MAELRVLSTSDLPVGAKKVVEAGETKILLINDNGVLCAVQQKCPHAGAPLEEGAVCNGRLICPWHLATFDLPGGELVEPPAMDSLTIYAVRSDGENIFVNPQPRLDNLSATDQAKQLLYLLVGAGAAGAIAARTLRQTGFKGRILVADPAGDEPVDRTQLSKDALGGNMPLEEIKLDAFAGQNIERINSSVVWLSAEQQEARLDSGAVIKFDKALVATGGKPKRLPIPGAELAHTIRHSDDVRRILEAITPKTRVVILGTSFIALEAASALVQKGLSVTVAGRETLPFAKQFGSDVANVLKKVHQDGGTVFKLGVELASISEDAVTVSNHGMETQVPADLVIMGVGVGPKLDFEHDLPIDPKGGIKTSQLLKAADAVWVAGDIAVVNGQRIEHWRVAQQHGRLAALGMTGKDAATLGVPYFWTYHFGTRYGYLGHASEWDETFTKGDLEGDEFLVFYIKDGLVKAVLNCGVETQMAALAEPMRGNLTLQEALLATK